MASITLVNNLKTVGLCMFFALCLWFTLNTAYNSNEKSNFQNGPVPFKKIRTEHNVKEQQRGLIQRSALPRNTYFISTGSESPSSKFYTTWSEESPRPMTKIRENKRKILVWNSWPTMGKLPKRACSSMPECEFTTDRGEVDGADAVIFWFRTMPNVYNRSRFPHPRPAHQYWIIRMSECPHFTRHTDWISYGGVFNWTMTYRNDSDIYMPWGHITQLYREINRKPGILGRHYPKTNGALVIWYVSNCYKYLSRFAYATELMKYIRIDVFGDCGKDFCGSGGKDCFDNHIRQYKFYLAFENFKCIEYITEKFWRNALRHDAVPVVLGAPKGDYERLTPPNSFIHVDDFKSPKALASYLLFLSKNEEKYMAFFAWKKSPPKTLPYFQSVWCELCSKLMQVSNAERKVYHDIDKWWKGANYEFCEPVVMLAGNIRQESVVVHYP